MNVFDTLMQAVSSWTMTRTPKKRVLFKMVIEVNLMPIHWLNMKEMWWLFN